MADDVVGQENQESTTTYVLLVNLTDSLKLVIGSGTAEAVYVSVPTKIVSTVLVVIAVSTELLTTVTNKQIEDLNDIVGSSTVLPELGAQDLEDIDKGSYFGFY